jgi:hypothetical protein
MPELDQFSDAVDIVDLVEVRDLRRRLVAARRSKLRAA